MDQADSSGNPALVEGVREVLAGSRATLSTQLSNNFKTYCETWITTFSRQLAAASSDSARSEALASLATRLGPSLLAELVADTPVGQQPSFEAVFNKAIDKAREELDKAAARVHRNALVELSQAVLETLRSSDPKMLWATLPEAATKGVNAASSAAAGAAGATPSSSSSSSSSGSSGSGNTAAAVDVTAPSSSSLSQQPAAAASTAAASISAAVAPLPSPSGSATSSTTTTSSVAQQQRQL